MSNTVVGGIEEGVEATTLLKDETKSILSKSLEHYEDTEKMDKEEETEEGDGNLSPKQPVLKRRKKNDDEISLNFLSEVFLRIFYPISKCMGKSIAIGLVKSLDYSPMVILNHGTKMLTFTENAWDSFMKHLHLIECFLAQNMMGKKTNVRLLECDIEIDIIRQRGEHVVRFKNLSKYLEKIILSREEFYTLSCVTPAVTRYMKQLVFSYSVVRDYLIETMDKQPDSLIIHGPIDTSIFNRLPHEVEIWRSIKEYEQKINSDTTEEEEYEENKVKTE